MIIFAPLTKIKIEMKRVLFSMLLAIFAATACTSEPSAEEFITDCEKSDFVKTPHFDQTMEFFH